MSNERKKVYQYDLQGEYIGEHKSGHDAAKYVGIAYSAMSRVLHGRQYTCGGYQWSWDKVKKLPTNALSRQGKRGKGKEAQGSGIITNERLAANLYRELPLTDFGVIDGRHKIKLGTMEIYFKPGKPVADVVAKYSRVNLDW